MRRFHLAAEGVGTVTTPKPLDGAVAMWGQFIVQRPVPMGGYQIIDRLVPAPGRVNQRPSVATGPWLVPKPDEGSTDRTYKGKITHREFSRLGRSPAKILAFANKHGLLGKGLVLVDPTLPANQPGARGESLDYWYKHIREMAYLVALWELIRAPDEPTLRRLVKWDGPGQVQIFVAGYNDKLDEGLIKLMRRGRSISSPRNARADGPAASDSAWAKVQQASADGAIVSGESRLLALAHPPLRAELLSAWSEGDVLGPAQYYLADRINDRLARSDIGLDPFHELQFRTTPQTLLDLLYLLLAIEVAGGDGSPMRSCDRPGCMEEFRPADPRQKYCSDNCRKRALEQRHRESAKASTGAVL